MYTFLKREGSRHKIWEERLKNQTLSSRFRTMLSIKILFATCLSYFTKEKTLLITQLLTKKISYKNKITDGDMRQIQLIFKDKDIQRFQ